VADRYDRLADGLPDPQDPFVAGGLATNLRGLYLLHRGDCEAAIPWFFESIGRARATRTHTTLASASASLSLGFQVGGNLAAAYRAGAEMVRFGQAHDLRGMLHWGLAVQGGALLRSGRLAESEERLRTAIDLARDLPDFECLARATGDLARCLLRQGCLDQAAECLAQARRDGGLGRVRGAHATFLHGARLELGVERTRMAGGLTRSQTLELRQDLRLARAEARVYRPAMTEVLRLRGTLAWLGGDSAKARGLWGSSIRLAERQGAGLEAALGLLAIARSSGDGEAARAARERMTGLALAIDTRIVRKAWA
jgi:tetratricopeptide (TPR) repeat protein